MVPARTVIASGEVSSSGTGIQWEVILSFGLKRMIFATSTLATTMSHITIRMYSAIAIGFFSFGRSGQ